jgi:dienelactone hydrolase
MAKKLILVILVVSFGQQSVFAQNITTPDTIAIQSGELTLKGLLWRPNGNGKFPSIIFCQGSYESTDTTYDQVKQASTLGPLFAKHGYIFFTPFRRGSGLSNGQGKNVADLMKDAFNEKGQQGRNEIQMQQLETDQMQDMVAALSIFRKRKDVDPNRIAIVGHSFGGSLSFLMIEKEKILKAAVVFGAAGKSWNNSPQLRNRLMSAVKNIKAPVMMIYAQNDYSINPGIALDSLMNQINKPHKLKIYPAFGRSQQEGHNLIFLDIEAWEEDVFRFLKETLKD